MKGHQMKHIFIVIFSLAVLVSCDSHDTEGQDAVERLVTSVSVSCGQRTAAPGIETRGDGEEDEDIAPPIIIDSFDNKSLLYFSQLGATDALTPRFDELGEEASPYVYIYEYKQVSDATWDDKYNFSVQEGRRALDWDSVKSVGSVGNAFSLFAFYFPEGNEVRFAVETDQTDETNFKKSDIMGAYHATSSLYTRLRFRLFHLMVYLKVTLYVPVYKDKNGTDKEYSGFYEDALKGAYVLNANTDFTISWRAKRSSDTEAPLTQTGNNKDNITMYRHGRNRTIDNFEVKDYYTGGTLTSDHVEEYNFSVLFPAQTFGDKFLCFALQAPDNSMKYYYFSASQIVGDSKNYGLTQGTLQQLYLYLPRTTNETILVGAKILPWKDAVTDMTVTQQTTNQDSND